MLRSDDIKLIINALDEQFQKEKDKYMIAKQQIQNLCPHKELELVMGGKMCTTCKKLIIEKRTLGIYVKKEEEHQKAKEEYENHLKKLSSKTEENFFNKI